MLALIGINSRPNTEINPIKESPVIVELIIRPRKLRAYVILTITNALSSLSFTCNLPILRLLARKGAKCRIVQRLGTAKLDTVGCSTISVCNT